tara:strand:+ start:4518 stop:5369 length:852 start_codon:yes stop_codon:yes gene_type:complete
MRKEWTLSTELDWNSIRAEPGCGPRSWIYEQPDGSVLLKNTNRGVYDNRLVDPLTFQYDVPDATSPAAAASRERLLAEARSATKSIEVRLFCTAHAFDHYLGEWVVESLIETPTQTLIVLKRLQHQNPVLAGAYRLQMRARSQSEAKHFDFLKAWLPGWHIAHEPEAAVGLDAPLISGGRSTAFSGDAYTLDYVAASPSGCKRLCIESKASLDGLTEEAKEKCRLLRDKSLSRVIALVGHGVQMRIVDFGTPLAEGGECEYMTGEHAALRETLGLPIVEEEGG